MELCRRHRCPPSRLWSQLQPSSSSHSVAVTVVVTAAGVRAEQEKIGRVEEGGDATPSSSNCHRWSSPLRLLEPLPACFMLCPCSAPPGLRPVSPCSSELVVLLWESLPKERNCRHCCSAVSFTLDAGEGHRSCRCSISLFLL
ncbi:uncharacterized protein LOC110272133 [Arachis ipaensis]|uniref:uncharacterized protein LOC110272133 n=1 Tax=Arachis ipaensis TaxID=130454 RepID=UPI000A2AFC04|nr:uncharacterized protein LOC110272133 [Arachis ipaensis]